MTSLQSFHMSVNTQWLNYAWFNNEEEFQNIVYARKPNNTLNDLVIELLRRAEFDDTNTQFVKSYWKRQIEVKKRTESKVEYTHNKHKSFIAQKIEGENSSQIEQFIANIQKENLPKISTKRNLIQKLHINTDQSPSETLQNTNLTNFWIKFFSVEGLRFCISLLIGPYRNTPWEPLLNLLIILLLWTFENEIFILSENSKLEYLFGLCNLNSSSKKNALEILFDHLYQTEHPQKQLIGKFAKLLNYLIRLQDIIWIQKHLQHYFCEVLLKELVTIKNDDVVIPQPLNDLFRTYNIPQKVFTTKAATKEKLFISWFIIPFFSKFKSLKEEMKKLKTNSIQERDIIDFFIPILDLFVGLTSQVCIYLF